MPLIYVIVVNYNGKQDTVECVESLLSANYKDIQIVIIDNASVDDSVPYIKEQFDDVSNIEIIVNQNNIGFAAANNIGIHLAIQDKADYVLLLNNDTIVEANFLDKIVVAMDKDKKCGIYSGKIKNYYSPEKIWYAGGKLVWWKGNGEHFGNEQKDGSKFDCVTKVTFVSGCYMLMKSDVIKIVGDLSEDYFLYFEDTDYCCRFIERGLDLVYFPESVIYHKISATTKRETVSTQYYLFRNRFIFIKNNLKNGKKIIAYIYTTTSVLKALIKKEVTAQIVKKVFNDFLSNKVGKYYN